MHEHRRRLKSQGLQFTNDRRKLATGRVRLTGGQTPGRELRGGRSDGNPVFLDQQV